MTNEEAWANLNKMLEALPEGDTNVLLRLDAGEYPMLEMGAQEFREFQKAMWNKLLLMETGVLPPSPVDKFLLLVLTHMTAKGWTADPKETPPEVLTKS